MKFKLYGFNYEDLSGLDVETKSGIIQTIKSNEINFINEFETEEDICEFIEKNNEYEEFLIYDGENFYN